MCKCTERMQRGEGGGGGNERARRGGGGVYHNNLTKKERHKLKFSVVVFWEQTGLNTVLKARED